MNKYKVTISYTEYAIIEVNAASKQDAETIAYSMLEEEGVPHDATTTDRDYSIDEIDSI